MGIINFEELKRNFKRIKENEDRKIKIYIEELKGEMVFSLISSKEFLEILEEKYDDKDALLVYNSCIEPNIKDDKFIKELGCNSEPYDIVQNILSQATIIEISEMILQESGIKNKGKKLIELISEDIKN